MENRIKAALGQIKADLVLKNGIIVDVFCHRLIEGDVAIHDGIIVGIGGYEGVKEIDITGKYVMPAFIDSHVHIESSMLTPTEYAGAVIPFGVTTIITDPHEILNVCGENGLRFMINSADNSMLDVYFMAPSCVPATEFEHSGSVIDSKLLRELKNKYKFIGLAEMMNYVGVINCDDEILRKISLFNIIDGHAPGLSGNQLNAYISGGIGTDHECETVEEVREKLGRGMFILAREGTAAKNLEAIMKAVNPYTVGRIAFCTDDKHIDEIVTEGTISHCVNRAIELGVDPIDAITMASYNAAKCYGLKNKGAIAPNYCADLLICHTIDAKNIMQVYKNGKLVAEEGKALFEVNNKIKEEVLKEVTNTVNASKLKKGCFTLEFDKNRPVIEVLPNSIITKKAYVNSADDLTLCAVIERHKALGHIGLAHIKGITIKDGAVAQSIGHDSHNITAIGDGEDNIKLAVEALGTDGGISVVKNGKVLSVLNLNIAGLMSDKTISEVVEEKKKLVSSLKSICNYSGSELLMVLSFVSLIVIPEIRLNDNGLFDVTEWNYIR